MGKLLVEQACSLYPDDEVDNHHCQSGCVSQYVSFSEPLNKCQPGCNKVKACREPQPVCQCLE